MGNREIVRRRRGRGAFRSFLRLDLIILLSLCLAWSPLGVVALFTFVDTSTSNAFGRQACPQAQVSSTQSGTEVTTSAGTVTVAITSVDPARSFLTFSTSSNSSRPVGSTIRGRIASATTLEFARSTDEGSPPAITVSWSVVQYSCGVQVQRGAVTQSATTTDVPITPVSSTNQAFLTWSKTVDPTEQDWGPSDQTAGRLTSTSNIRFDAHTAQGGGSGGAPWYDPAWSYRKQITIDHTRVSGTQTEFPVLVSITDADLKVFGQANGNDVLFTSSDGTTDLAHEIESYNSGTGALVAWVDVPTLSSTADTVLYLYYGNSTTGSQQAVNATWETHHKTVLHLPELPTATAPQFQDSTGNDNHATAQGSMLAGAPTACWPRTTTRTCASRSPCPTRATTTPRAGASR